MNYKFEAILILFIGISLIYMYNDYPTIIMHYSN